MTIFFFFFFFFFFLIFFFLFFFFKLVESIDLEEVLLNEDQNYMVTGLSVNQKAATDVIILDLNARHS